MVTSLVSLSEEETTMMKERNVGAVSFSVYQLEDPYNDNYNIITTSIDDLVKTAVQLYHVSKELILNYYEHGKCQARSSITINSETDIERLYSLFKPVLPVEIPYNTFEKFVLEIGGPLWH